MTGMIPLTNEFVMLELRPVIFTGFGIANRGWEGMLSTVPRDPFSPLPRPALGVPTAARDGYNLGGCHLGIRGQPNQHGRGQYS